MSKNSFNSKSEVNKPLFAAYINMARNNMFLVIKHISTSLQLRVETINENRLHDCELMNLLRNSRKPELTQRAIKMIDRYMPFIKPLYYNFYNDKNQAFAAEKHRCVSTAV